MSKFSAVSKVVAGAAGVVTLMGVFSVATGYDANLNEVELGVYKAEQVVPVKGRPGAFNIQASRGTEGNYDLLIAIPEMARNVNLETGQCFKPVVSGYYTSLALESVASAFTTMPFGVPYADKLPWLLGVSERSSSGVFLVREAEIVPCPN
ncbi:MAG: hypothetical protein LRY54_02990 [Alphaproteobacteria bacterium]|nr:hypothetical protein [Alphaproteobacteria bacterium]